MDSESVGDVELVPHYYRDNFQALCDTVEAQYGDLLTPSEQQFLQGFRQLPFDAQCLYVRLVSRVGPWFRESKLAYPELGPIPAALDSLIASGMAEPAKALYVEELGGLYTVPELRQVFGPLLGDSVRGNKSQLLEAIEELGLKDSELMSLLEAIDSERIIAPCGLGEVALFQLLFFGNRYQSLTEFVLSDLGVARYYPYPLDREYRLFAHREAVEEYLACAELSDYWYELREGDDASSLPQLAEEVLNLDIRFPSSESRWHRLCNGLARDLERLGELNSAARLYERSARHPARERRLRILERLEDWSGAVRLSEHILDEPWCEEERDAAGRVLPRVQRKLGAVPTRRRRDDFPRLDLKLAREEVPVEVLAARQLESQWVEVRYVENSLMNALFGLAFWEQIFAPVPGAFHNPFQGIPTDMYSPDFRARRQPAREARMAQLRAEGIEPLLQEAYTRYASFQCRWVDWRRCDAALLMTATRVIPDAHLLAVWERMLFDPRENRRGFPDLIALGEDTGDYCLIEVKGPGDTLQESQKRWLRFFARQGIPATVAWVSWQEKPDD
jgi:Fanconi-associated nuclease 1-like protein/VRR-NUC domain-containing protein/Fanconi anemia protein nuclease-like protein